MISTVLRRVAGAVTLVTVLGGLLLVAGPASADTPEPRPGSWEPKPDIDQVHMWLYLGGVPLLVFLVISALVLGPALARGESIGASSGEPDSHWIGGPRKAAGELADPDTEDSAAGGAGGTW